MRYIDFSKIFHQFSKDHTRGCVPLSVPTTIWSQEREKQLFKVYPRFPKVALPRRERRADFFALIRNRATSRTYDKRPITLADIGSLLEYSCGVMQTTDDGIKHRAQPSSGGRFPIEMYVAVFVASDDLSAGVYHYDVADHTLSLLWKRDFTREDIRGFFGDTGMHEASVAFFMTAIFSRMQKQYGERGYRYILLEAGRIGQNLSLAAEALGLQSSVVDGTDDEAIERLLDIDGVGESLISTMSAGNQ